MFFCVFFQIPTTPECWPQEPSSGGSHWHSDFLQEQRLRSVDSGRWHRHPELWVSWLRSCDVINFTSSRELLMFLMKNDRSMTKRNTVMLTVCAGSMMQSHHNSLWRHHLLFLTKCTQFNYLHFEYVPNGSTLFDHFLSFIISHSMLNCWWNTLTSVFFFYSGHFVRLTNISVLSPNSFADNGVGLSFARCVLI